MKLAWSNTLTLLATTALVLVSNAIALGGVAYNRGGEADSVLQLTERELPIQYWSWPDNDNSAVHLELRWRVASTSDEWWTQVDWLTRDQLRQLGFRMPAADATPEQMERYVRQSAREVFFALEFDGPAYRAALARAHKRLLEAETKLALASSDRDLLASVRGAKAEVEEEEHRTSRLFVVAADLDSAALRTRYPDRKHYAIVRGRIDLGNGNNLIPRIGGIETDTIRVPHAYRAVVEPYVSDRSYTQREPRYAATVHFGRRLEPWIVQLSRM